MARKPVFNETARTWGFNEEGMQLYLTDERYVWVADKDGCITFDGEINSGNDPMGQYHGENK